jgi:hypothetical protein
LLLSHPSTSSSSSLVSYQHNGNILDSVESYRLAIQARHDLHGEGSATADYTEAWLNLAALHHSHGTFVDAIWHYNRTIKSLMATLKLEGNSAASWEKQDEHSGALEGEEGESIVMTTTLDMLVMVHNNVGQAHSQSGQAGMAIKHHEIAASILSVQLKTYKVRTEFTSNIFTF